MATKTNESQASSLVTDAYDYLVEAITSFKLPTNAPISENKLATQLGISRTPIRQALQRLESEGLITKSDSSRFSVTLVTPKQVEEACDLLQIIDTYLFTKAAQNLDKKGADQLITLTQEMIKAAENNDRDNWSKADTRFHDLVINAADNQTVASLAIITRRKIQRFWTKSAVYENRLVSCSKEHEVLAKAIVNKDLKAIEPAVLEHMAHMRSSILKTLNLLLTF
ncbi:MAG: GntR family transcriptional regulator [Actinomycetota bacterium]|nr:GntR family transcriptional regulator [Actinomycetota bacterium]